MEGTLGKTTMVSSSPVCIPFLSLFSPTMFILESLLLLSPSDLFLDGQL